MEKKGLKKIIFCFFFSFPKIIEKIKKLFYIKPQTVTSPVFCSLIFFYFLNFFTQNTKTIR